MGLILFIAFVVLELAFVVITFAKQCEKVNWIKNRALFRIVEFMILLLVLAVPGISSKWRFYGCFVILLLRLLFAGIAFLLKRKKASGSKSKAGVAVGAVLSILLIGFSLVPAFIFTGYSGLENTGKYEVKHTKAILVDRSRIDSFEDDGSFREVPAHFYYPDSTGDSFPLIVFAHGAFGYYESNYSTYTELASNGYVVVSLDHPHHAFFTEDTDGNIVTVDTDFIMGAINATNGDIPYDETLKLSHEWLKLRTDDESFVLDTIKLAKSEGTLSDVWQTDYEKEILDVIKMTDVDAIGLMGHSLGGAESVQVGRERSDIKAVIDIDGTMFGEWLEYNNGEYVYINEPYPVPLLEFSNESAYNGIKRDKANSDLTYVNTNTINRAVDGRLVMFKNTEHMDFTDLPLISPFFALMLGKGTVNSEEFLPEMNGIILDYFDYYLKGEGTLNIKECY